MPRALEQRGKEHRLLQLEGPRPTERSLPGLGLSAREQLA